MTVVLYHRLVERDVARAIRHYERQVPGLGREFLDEVDRTMLRVAISPLIGARVRGDVRRQLVHRFPYAILYRADGEEVFILTVMHQHRHPDSWQSRLT
jgi:plasmid stabilization system protein ParE